MTDVIPDGGGQAPISGVLRDRLRSSMWTNIFLQPVIMLVSVLGSVVVSRVLGPELLAVTSVVAATVAPINVFLDFGLTTSLSKIMPDVSVCFGRAAALRVWRTVAFAKILLVLLGFLGLLLLYTLGKWKLPQDFAWSVWFFPLVGVKLVVGTLLVVRQYSAIAAFRNKTLAQLSLLLSVIAPGMDIAAVLLWRDPYVLVAVSLIPTLVHMLLLSRFASYDLDEVPGGSEVDVSFAWLLKEYWRYGAVTYLVFLFNRLVYGLPLTLWILTWQGADAYVIGNVSLAVSIIQRGWDVANTPLSSLRGPLLARLHAEQDEGRFFRVQRLMVAVVVLTSGVLAVCVLALGPLVFGVLYGPEYETGVSWGVLVAVVALVANFFTLGNSTLHQTNRFLPELIGMAVAALFMIVSGLTSSQFVSGADWPLAVLLGYVGGRALFWFITDMWADGKMFQWEGSGIKFRGLLAVGVGLACVAIIGDSRPIGQALAAMVGVLSFLGVFRLLGGVGDVIRASIAGLLGSRLGFVARFI